MKEFAVFVILLSASMAKPNHTQPKTIRRTVDYCNVQTCVSPYIFRSGKADHTRCNKGYELTSTGPACKGAIPVPLSSKYKEIIVNLHNTVRSKIALGLQEGQPIATNMRQLVWDDELSELAQVWANQCIFENDICRNVDRFTVGQNLGFWKSSNPNPIFTDVMAIIRHWFTQINDFDGSWVSGGWSNAFGNIGVYTQMMWAETYLVGCGAIQYEGNDGNVKYETFVVCNYGPAGNTVGEPVYRTGTTSASECLPGTQANTETGLCEGEASIDNTSITVLTGSGGKPSINFANECPPGKQLNIETGLCEKLPSPVVVSQCPPGTQINTATNLCEGTPSQVVVSQCPTGTQIQAGTNFCVGLATTV